MNGNLQDGEGVDIGKKHKLGHLRVDTQGHATFKHLPTNQLVEALQLGIQHSVGGLTSKPAHDVLLQDFSTIEIISFPKSGRTAPKATPPHRFSDFIIRSYAPVAFRHFREQFNIKPEDYLFSIDKPFRELKNPGASGSLFYLTADDEFIIKTVQKKEAHFLRALLPGYYMNITQNKRTLLPKFFGLYCYQGENKNIRIIVMNNLLPSNVQMHEKYDLKGSTFKRRASNEEKQKESPTWKDLDFMERHPQGLILDVNTFNALAKTIQRDCRVLESFHIMDYSFLIGIHKLDEASESPGDHITPTNSLNPFSQQRKRMMYTTPMYNIQAEFDERNTSDDNLVKIGGIPARTATGEKLSLYVGIIDILQPYQIRKKLEHTLKSAVTDGSQISVTNPSYYSERFQKFLFSTVFKKSSQRTSRISTYDTHTNPIHTTDHRSISTTYVPSPILDYNESNPSTETIPSSYSTSYNTSFKSSQRSESRNQHGSSTTIYGSSHQSDSLYNEPTISRSARIKTTSFNSKQKQNSRLKFYKEFSTSSNKIVNKRQNLSTSNLSYGNNLSEYSSYDNQSSEEITRL